MTESFQSNSENGSQSADLWTPVRDRLTDGLTHDFNNLITGIHALTEALRFEAGSNQSLQEPLGLIRGNALKARELLHRIVALQRSKPGTKSYFNLSELTASTVELMKKALPGSLSVTTTLAAETLPVYLDAVAFTRTTVTFTFALANTLIKGSKLQFETGHHEDWPHDAEPSGENLTGACMALTIKVSQPGPALSPMSQSLAWEDWLAFARSHGGWVRTQKVSDTEVIYALHFPEADLAQADSLQQV